MIADFGLAISDRQIIIRNQKSEIRNSSAIRIPQLFLFMMVLPGRFA
jgi:hypothetical protein